MGINVNNTSDFMVVAEILPDSPAATADVRVGDRIIRIDGVATASMKSAQELVDRASGSPGSEIDIELQRAGAASTFHLRLRRIPRKPKSTIPSDFTPNQA